MTDYSAESGRRADPQRPIEFIHDIETDAGREFRDNDDRRNLDWNSKQNRTMVRELADDWNEPILPGFGPEGHAGNARDDCGNPHPFACDCCGASAEFGRTCGQSVCGRCGVTWVRDAATSKAAKVRRVRREKHQSTADREHQKIHHQVISPPLTWYATLFSAGYSVEEARDETWRVVKTILDEQRGQGVVARHSYRGVSDDGTPLDESDDRGRWKERLNSDREWFGDVRDELAWRPHFHAIVVSDYLQGSGFTDVLEEHTGWVVHRITDDNGVSLRNDGDMAKALTYSLSHADIEVRDGANNSSAVREVGSFEGDIIKSSSRFSARPSDIAWADECVRDKAPEVLGLRSSTTDCGNTIPPVDDPDEFARRVLEEVFPNDDRPEWRDATDAVLYHVNEGNITVNVSTTSGGGGSVSVSDAWGQPVGADGFDGDLPSPSTSVTFDGSDDPLPQLGDDDQEGTADLRSASGSDEQECDGTMVPLGELRQRGLLDDPDWCRTAAHVDEARAADREWPDDLDPWRSSSAGKAVG